MDRPRGEGPIRWAALVPTGISALPKRHSARLDYGMAYTQAPRRTSLALLEGVWVNQHGSEVTLAPDSTGQIRGEYSAGAGALAGRVHPVVGTYQHDPTARTVPLAFFVTWTEAHCVTTWCGHLIPGEDRIEATWLMATESESRDEWRSTIIGHDLFRRRPEEG